MRLKISLSNENENFKIPINYQYILSSVIYNKLWNSSPEFSKWLHSTGYKFEGKPFKLFTFSRLFIPKAYIKAEMLYGKGSCHFYFSTPIEKKIVNHFVNGVLSQPEINISSNGINTKFLISSIETLPPANLNEETKYRMLSPTCCSIKRIYNDSEKISYLLPKDKESEEIISNNLKKKHKLIYDKEYNDKIRIQYDWENIKKRQKITKLITVKKNRPDEIKVRAFICPLTITASQEIQRIAYDCGIGEKNSMGFGCLEVERRGK